MTLEVAVWVLWCLPLGLAVLVGLLPSRAAGLAHGLAAAGMAVATALAVGVAWHVLGGGGRLAAGHLPWLPIPGGALGIGLAVDAPGAVLAVLVTLLATLVLLYNRWYMHDEPRAARFPWQFCGFAFAMLGIVLADNLFLTFVCWELVGLGSYLLIGFYGERPTVAEAADYQANKPATARGVLEHLLSPAHAQLKAFVVNRVGDAGFLLGLGALLVWALGQGASGNVLGFAELLALRQAGTVGDGVLFGLGGDALLGLGMLGVFAGCVGKSAQFPLHTWLPDAMQGPTTASSIIHAATMVAAGVFLAARCLPLFPPEALLVVGLVGGTTCLLGAVIACVQWDLKAVLAYSTMSQLGLMFVGLSAGVDAGGRAAGLAHLFTHAGFKCLLFLAAGAVIHAAHGLQDLHRLGGLRKAMPVTAWCSLLGVLAIVGAPFGAGFYSKDAVLAAAWAAADARGGLAWAPFLLAAAGSLLTGAYMLRWWLRIFAGAPREPERTAAAHDPAGLALLVLPVLAVLTLQLPWTAGGWLDHALQAPTGEATHHAHQVGTAVALGLLAVGAAFAWVVFGRPAGANVAQALATRFAALHRAAAELLWLDAVQERVVVDGVGRRGARQAAALDLGSAQRLGDLDQAPPGPDAAESIDGLVDGFGRTAARLGDAGARLGGGHTGAYLAIALVAGLGALWWGMCR